MLLFCNTDTVEVHGIDGTVGGGKGGGNKGVVLDFDGSVVAVEELGRAGQDWCRMCEDVPVILLGLLLTELLDVCSMSYLVSPMPATKSKELLWKTITKKFKYWQNITLLYST